ncbi:MAG: hypothetical protein KDK38_03495 [Leptospiraceae bacterium]|nr:hypothetical protein [Leptospiraceae bacterium]
MKKALTGSWQFLLIGGLLMAAMPIGERPHLLQKLELLFQGYLIKPEDWFDLALHGLPLILGIISTVIMIIDRFMTKKTENS